MDLEKLALEQKWGSSGAFIFALELQGLHLFFPIPVQSGS